MNENEDDDLLDILLSAASEELDNSKVLRPLTEVDLFGDDENESPSVVPVPGAKNGIIHSGDTDSSDEEGNRNFEERKYNDCGRDIKHLLNSTSDNSLDSEGKIKKRISYWKKPTLASAKSTIQSNSWAKNPSNIKSSKLPEAKIDVYTDPVFGIRIVNPLISSTLLQERMIGREAVSFDRVDRFLQMKGKEKDWAIAGVIVNKSAVKTSKKGSQFSIWTLSDLKGNIKTVSLFLFSSAHNQLWKTSVGVVIGVLNPNVLDKRDGSKDEACLSIDTHQKVMIFGQSKDFGTCKSMKKSGEKCTAIVNKNRCEFCLYHIKQEYQKCSQRSELQSNFAGRGLTALRNKVLGKNEVFYAGKSYMAIPAKKSRKMDQMDTNRLNCLSSKNDGIDGAKAKTKPVPRKKLAASKLDVPQAQRIKDIELLKKLGGLTEFENKNNFSGNRSTDITLEESKNIATSVISKLKAKTTENKQIETNEDKIELSVSHSSGISLEESKSTALSVINKLKAKKMDVSMIDSAKDNNSKQETKINEPLDNNLSDSSFGLDTEFTELESLDYDDDNDDSMAQLQSKNNTSTPPANKKSTPPANKKSTPPANKKSPPKVSLSNGKVNIDIPKETESTKSTFLFNKTSAITFPKLSGFEPGKMIDLNKPMSRQMTKAKLNAIKLIKKSGPIKKADPNNIRGSGKKRPIEEITENSAAKKSKLAESEFISDRFKKMMAMTSSHMDLLEARDEEAEEKYFNKLEAKEQMEEKMTNTFKMACKAVKCLKCKYTSFSASDLCKTERHPLRVFDAMKRFFKCGNCGNRTVSLEIIPTRPCTNCGSGKWEKTGMMKEKLVTAAHSLSIRGGEQKFTNSVVSDANINLLVPES